MTAARRRVVTNTMLRPNGDPVYPKTVSVALNNPVAGWESNHVNEILTKGRAETDRTGTWSITLDCNADIEDGSSYYTVSQASGEVWAFVVPVGDFAVPVHLRDILVTAPGTSNPAGLVMHTTGEAWFDTALDSGGHPVVTLHSPWGIHAGVPYFEDTGADPGEAAYPIFEDDGTLALVQPNGAVA